MVGKGEGREILPSGHVIQFISSAKSNSGVVSLDEFDFVFQHLSNPETLQAIIDWRTQKQDLKILGFSGGKIALKPDEPNIPCLEGIGGRRSLLNLNWGAVPSNFSGTNDELVELLQAQSKIVLLALSVLCQGYLAAFAREEAGKWAPPAIEAALSLMAWSTYLDSAATGSLRENSLIKPSVTEQDTVSSPYWWQNIFVDKQIKVTSASDQIKVEGKIVQEWGSKIENCPLVELLKAIYITQAVTPRIVADAYCAIVHKLTSESMSAFSTRRTII